jgi:Fe-S-cluster containining protein
VKLPIVTGTQSLCDQCVALCCRYYAFEIDKPRTHRDFEDLRWYLFHGDTIIFIEAARWYVQVNRACKALLPDNRCGVYENRPTICRGYTTGSCDWHGDDYDYDELFTEPEQIERYGKEYLAQRRRRRRKQAAAKSTAPAKRKAKRARTVRVKTPVRLLKSA